MSQIIAQEMILLSILRSLGLRTFNGVDHPLPCCGVAESWGHVHSDALDG